MRRQRLRLWVMLLAVLLACTAAMGAATSLPARLERGNGPEPDSLDPARAQGLSAHQVLRDLFETLTTVAASGEIIPAAAKAWSVSPSGLEWRFELAEGGRYADGRLVTASDFVFSLRRALTASTGAPYAGLLLVIANAKAVLSGELPPSSLGVTAEGDSILVIRLERPSLDLPARMALPITAPLDRHQLERDGAAFARGGKLNGNGAYRLVDWRPGAWIDVEANPHFRKHRDVQIQAVRFHVTPDASQEALRFAAGELHWTESVPLQPESTLRQRFGHALHLNVSYGTFFLGLNVMRPPLSDSLAVRQALSFAIDRERLVRSITGLGEQPAFGLLPSSQGVQARAAPPCPTPPYDQGRVACAQALWQQARDQGQAPDQLSIRFNTSPLHRRTMLAVAAMWREVLGLETQLRQEDWKVFVSHRRARRITQVFRGGWNADLLDPINFLEPFESTSLLNATGLNSTPFDHALHRAQSALDRETRRLAVLEAEHLLLEQQVIIPLYHYTDKHLVVPELKGWQPHPLGHYPSAQFRFAP